jgi:epsilon-lactone hydrolase
MTENAIRDLYVQWGEESSALFAGQFSPIALTRYQTATWIDLASEPVGVRYRDIDIDGLHALAVQPDDAPRGPVILYFHGGAYVAGSSTVSRKMNGHLALAAGTSVLSVDYRLAPDNLFPAQLEDALKAWNWLVSHDYHPADQIVLAGDSAGGNIAAALAQYLRDKGLGRPAGVVCFSPFFDVDAHGSTYDEKAGLDKLANREAAAFFLPVIAGPTATAKDPYLSALTGGAQDLPPFYITFGGDEALMGGGIEFKEQADAVGTDVELDVTEGQQHVFQYMAGRDAVADASLAKVGAFVKRVLGRA